MKKIFTLILISGALFACEKYPGPGSELLESFNYSIWGNNQLQEEGKYLDEEVGAFIDLAGMLPKTDKQFRLEIAVTKGGGSVDREVITADKNGKMTTKWKLGNDSNEQELNCRILNSDEVMYGEFNIRATAFLMNDWNEISKDLLVGIQDMVYDTVRQRSLLISRGDIYLSTDKFYRWEPSYLVPSTSIKELEINSKGEVFAAGWNGNLYKSINGGVSWMDLGKPIPNNSYHYELSISKDDYIWASKWDYGIYCSKDNGLTWTKDTEGIVDQEEMGPVFSIDDSSHISLSQSRLIILRTDDDGLSWYPVNTPEYSLSIFVTDEEDIIAQNQDGFSLNKSIDGGQTYKRVFSTIPAFGTQSKHCYGKFGNHYYVLAPGGGVWETDNFDDFMPLIRFSEQRNLFIDHRGTIYACGYRYSNAEDQPTFILPNAE